MQFKKPDAKFKAVDILLLFLVALPFLAAIALKVLFMPAGDGMEITGAFIFFTIKLPVMDLPISEAQVNSWAVVVSVLFLCLYLTHGIRARVTTKRQILAEWAVEKLDNLVKENMGDFFMGFAPFVCAILMLSALSSLSSLLGLFAPTSDLNIAAGWALLVFFLITYYKLKGGPLYYIKGFFEPLPVMLPMNILGEVATPVAMTLRHYGNILSGSVISILLAGALQALTKMVLGKLPGFFGEFPFFQIGIPAVLSVYFDLFSGCLQAFIFVMLTMLFVSTSFPADEYWKRMNKKAKKQKLS